MNPMQTCDFQNDKRAQGFTGKVGKTEVLLPGRSVYRHATMPLLTPRIGGMACIRHAVAMEPCRCHGHGMMAQRRSVVKCRVMVVLSWHRDDATIWRLVLMARLALGRT